MQSGSAQNVLFTQYAQSCIKVKARQLSRRSEFSRSDEGDLENDLWVSLLKKATCFDPERSSSNTFADRVVNSAAGMIVRRQHRQKRAQGCRAISLDATKIALNSGSKKPLSQHVSEADLSRRTGSTRHDDIAHRENVAAIEHALLAMPEDLRDLCRLVMGGSIASAARDMGNTRRRVRETLQAARPYLEQSGLGTN